ncbi:GH92 family glycosyl hydrolase [Phaeacidiphilus oryzae]|uniref:GH92 family glycosyl hydrolase n=1 Tax=Phaeacidiphilus oryzae TaxID=348818 RepID=UPI00068F69FF|nr:lectin [Phaeacidiphilus oryzae]
MARPARAPSSRLKTALAGVSALAVGVLSAQALAAGPAQAAAPALVSDPASLVNPIIGTSGAVDTFPGADMPYGMLQWSPDTTPDRPSGGGYEYNDSKYLGYSLTHISGPGCGAGGDLPILPWTGDLSGNLGSTSVGFSHDNETAKAGYYKLTDNAGVGTELTTTTRAGVGRFTFPAGTPAQLLLKLSGGATKIDGTRAQIVGDNEVTGAIDSGHFCGASNTYTLHFDIKFDKSFTKSGTWTGTTVNSNATALKAGSPQQSTPTASTSKPALREKHFTVPSQTSPTLHGSGSTTPSSPPVTGANGVYLGFAAGSTVTAQVGISYTSDANATLNRTTELKGQTFDSVRQAAHDAWNKELGRIRVGGGSTDQQTQFYTALYHALLHPNVFSDVNGQYAGMDHQTHTLAKGQHAQYANYSGWDTYRSQTQLMAMVDPTVASDVATSMLNGYDQTGILPKWAQNNGESYVMVGDPADGIIADAYAFGARNFNTSHALQAMAYQATHSNNDRPGEAVRDAKGYLPIDGSNWGCCNFYGPVSTQEEYDTADYAIAALAKSLGQQGTYQKFASRAQDWQNVFDPQSGYLQAKLASGAFAPGFTPGTSNGFVEGTSAQYTPMIPFNIEGLIKSRGGDDAWNSYLDSLFTDLTNPSSTNADMSNEPSLEIPWEYDWTGQPWKAQQVVRDVQQKLWFNAPVGSFGNDDLGAMSSWYVWSELGMYPETPGTDTLALGSPVFPVAKVATGKGTLNINAPAAATGSPYVQSLSVNGKAWNKPWLSYASLANGGTMDYGLGSTPNTSWGSDPSAVPPSDSTGARAVLASSDAGLILAPGAQGSSSVNLRNTSDSPVTVSWTATPPSGVTLDSTSGSLTVPANGTAKADIKITAGQTEGSYSVPIALSTSSGDLPGVVLGLDIAKPGELWPYQSNTGVYADGATFTGGFDDEGWAYSQNQLTANGVATGGTVTADGITYNWPGGTGKPDNIETSGQTIPFTAPAGAASIGFLGAGTNSPSAGSKATVTVTYTDGSTSTGTLVFSDWTLNAGSSQAAAGDTVVAKTAYRNTASGGRDQVNTYVFADKLPLTAGKTVASVTLPAADSGTLHVFAVGFGS